MVLIWEEVGERVGISDQVIGRTSGQRAQNSCLDIRGCEGKRARVPAAVVLTVITIEDERRPRCLVHECRISTRILDLAAHDQVDIAISIGVEERAGIPGLAGACPLIGRIPTPEKLEEAGIVVIPTHLGQVDLGRVDVIRATRVDHREEVGGYGDCQRGLDSVDCSSDLCQNQEQDLEDPEGVANRPGS